MTKTIERIELPTSSIGTSRHLKVHRYGTPGAVAKAYFQGALHADETPGTLVAHHLIRRLDAEAAAGRVTGEILVVPVANPIGLDQIVSGRMIGRFDLAGRSNFNRDFPDLTRQVGDAVANALGSNPAVNVRLIRRAFGDAIAALQPIGELANLRVTLMRLAHDADIVVDMHCDSVALSHLYLSTDCWPDGADLSAAISSRGTLLALDSGVQSFDEVFSLIWHSVRQRFAGRFPIPVGCLSGTAEFRGQGDVTDIDAARDADGLIQFLRHRGLLAGTAALPPALCDATPLEATDVVRATANGVIVFDQPLGATIAKGQTFAWIIDPLADDQAHARTPVVSGTDGLFLTHCTHRQVRIGQPVAKIVGREPLPTRSGKLVAD
jgi:hypothetical protein